MHRHILIRPTGSPYGGKTLAYSVSELATIYSAEEIARLAIGLKVERDGKTHVDIRALHDRHATPDQRGSVFLRRIMKQEGLAA